MSINNKHLIELPLQVKLNFKLERVTTHLHVLWRRRKWLLLNKWRLSHPRKKYRRYKCNIESFKGAKTEYFLPAPLMKRASGLHLNGSTCGIDTAPLKAGTFFFPHKRRRVNRSRHEGPQPFLVFFLWAQSKEGANWSHRCMSTSM